MRALLKTMTLCAVAAMVLASGGSTAQTAMSWKLLCLGVGHGGELEPFGDKDGHALSTGDYVCRAEGGPLDGATFTGNTVWEWNGTTAELRSGGGTYRKGGPLAGHDRGEGKLALTLVDGKVTGWTANVRGTYNFGVGAGAALLGKTWTTVSRPTGFHQFTVDVKVE